MALETVTEGRHPVRVAAPTVTTSPTRDPRTADASRTVIDQTSVVERRTRVGIATGMIVFRVLVVGAMLLVAYLAYSQGWIPAATDAMLSWYTATIAPHMAIDPTVPQVPAGNGSLFGTTVTPSFVVTD